MKFSFFFLKHFSISNVSRVMANVPLVDVGILLLIVVTASLANGESFWLCTASEGQTMTARRAKKVISTRYYRVNSGS